MPDPKKPVLYVGLHGPILIHDENKDPDPFLNRSFADYARPFLNWALQHFDVRWLSENGPREAFYTARRLSLPDHAIPVASFQDSKIEAMDPKEHAFWIDAELIPSEVAWLAHHRAEDHFLQVDPQVGVQPKHKEQLQQKLQFTNGTWR